MTCTGKFVYIYIYILFEKFENVKSQYVQKDILFKTSYISVCSITILRLPYECKHSQEELQETSSDVSETNANYPFLYVKETSCSLQIENRFGCRFIENNIKLLTINFVHLFEILLFNFYFLWNDLVSAAPGHAGKHILHFETFYKNSDPLWPSIFEFLLNWNFKCL